MPQPRTGLQQGAGGAPLDRRYARAGFAYQDGAQVASPTIASGTLTITSSGIYGPYAIVFAPVVFSNTPAVVLTPGLSSGSLFTTVSVSAVSTLGISYYVMAFNPGQVVVPAAQTVAIGWIAVGT